MNFLTFSGIPQLDSGLVSELLLRELIAHDGISPVGSCLQLGVRFGSSNHDMNAKSLWRAITRRRLFRLGVSVAGASLFLSGQSTLPGTIIPGSNIALDRTNGSAVDAALVQAASATTAEGIAVGKLISNALTGGSPLSTVFPTTGLGAQLQQVARVIQVRSQLRMKRQIFFCSMGGFDTHSNQLNDQNNLFAELSPALTAFYNATAELAGDFTKFDEHAVQQINRNIELLRYRSYGKSLLLLELVNASSAESVAVVPSTVGDGGKAKPQYKGFADLLPLCSADLKDLWEALRAFLLAFGDDVHEKPLKYYMAFRRLKNFACVEVHPQSGELLVYTKVDPTAIPLQEGFTRDVANIGHYGTGDLEIRIRTTADLERAKSLLVDAYRDN